MTIGERITLIRKEKGLSQDAFGAMINVSRQSISKWEANISIPEVDKIIEISKKFDVSIEWLLGIKENRTNTNDFSEDQLTKIEEIIKKYSSIKSKKNIVAIIISSLLAIVLVISLIIGASAIKNRFNTLWWETNSLYHQMEEVKDTLKNQNEYLEKVEASLNEQKELIVEEIIFDQYDLQEETTHLIAKIRPKEYQSNTKIFVNVDNGIETITQQAKEIENRIFYVDIKIQLTDLIKVSGNIVNSNSEKYVSLIKYENKLNNTYYIPEENYEADFEVRSDKEQIFYVTNEIYTPEEVNPLEIEKVVTYIFVNDEFFGKQNASISYNQEQKMDEYKTVIDFSSLNFSKKQSFVFFHVLTDSHGRTYVVDGQKMEFSESSEGEFYGHYDRLYKVDKNFSWKQYE